MRKITKKVFAAVLALSLFAGFSASVASFAAEPGESKLALNKEDLTEEYLTTKKEPYIIDYRRYPCPYFEITLSDNTKLFGMISFYRSIFDAETGKEILNKETFFCIESAIFNSECTELTIPDTLFGIPVEVSPYTELILDDSSNRNLFPSRTIWVPQRIRANFEDLYLNSDSFANKNVLGETIIVSY